MDLKNIVFGFAILYTIFYPLVVYSIVSPNVVEQNIPIFGKMINTGIEHISIGDKVEVSVTRKYLFLTLPKYIGELCIDLFNKLWMVMFFVSIFFIVYKVL